MHYLSKGMRKSVTSGGEGWNFEQSNFRMTNISSLKINERSNVERPNLRVTTIENESWKDKASEFIYIKWKIWESAKLRVVGISNGQAIPKFANFRNFDSFPNSKISKNFLIFQFRKFLKFLIYKISKISNLKN